MATVAAELGFGPLEEAELNLLAIYYNDASELVREVREADVNGYEPPR